MGHPARLLVVDDEPDILESVASLLEPLPGIEVVTARSPKVALAMAKADGFAAVLSDFRMPGMNGCALIKEILQVKPDTAVGLMTAYGNAAREEMSCLGLSVDAFLPKPFEPHDLVQQVRSLLHL